MVILELISLTWCIIIGASIFMWGHKKKREGVLDGGDIAVLVITAIGNLATMAVLAWLLVG